MSHRGRAQGAAGWATSLSVAALLFVGIVDAADVAEGDGDGRARIGTDATPPRPVAPGSPRQAADAAPAFSVLRQDEYRAGTDGDPVGRLPVGDGGRLWVSYSLEAHLRYKRFHDEGFGDNPGSDGAFRWRLNPGVSLGLGDRARAYASLKYGRVDDKRAEVPVADDDGPDVHQTFAELSFGDAVGLAVPDVLVRIGRQELNYGVGRIVSPRGGSNVLRDHDGVLLRGRFGPVVADLMATRPSEDDPGRFDNGTDEARSLAGVYTSVDLGGIGASRHLDLYYLRDERSESVYAFQDEPVEETRHTIGARWWTDPSAERGTRYDLEVAFQLGRARGVVTDGTPSDIDVRASLFAGTIRRPLPGLPGAPELGLLFGFASGDDDVDDDRLGTFRPPYPPGRPFGESNPLGAGNIALVAPSIAFEPLPDLTLTAGVQGYWRMSTDDGIYSPPQTPVRGPDSDERHIGTEFKLLASHGLGTHLSLDASLARFVAGPYLDDRPPSDDIGYAALGITMRY